MYRSQEGLTGSFEVWSPVVAHVEPLLPGFPSYPKRLCCGAERLTSDNHNFTLSLFELSAGRANLAIVNSRSGCCET